jgi:hypothetical protein
MTIFRGHDERENALCPRDLCFYTAYKPRELVSNYYILPLSLLTTIHVPSFDVWRREVNLSVESPWSEEGGVKHVRSVGTSQDDYVSSRVETCKERVHDG